MDKLDPRDAGFRNIKNLMNRMEANRKTDTGYVISVEESDVPAWQRQVVWTEDEMGLLAYSIIRGFPIGMIILWNKPNGIRVPIDGRQRLNAIREFYKGNIAIPALPIVEDFYKNKKYKLNPNEEKKGFSKLSIVDKDAFDDYELKCIEYGGIEEKVAMKIFVMLQGGKSLTKTEVRAALGGKLCDFITLITTDRKSIDDENEEIIEDPKNPFFKALSTNTPNRRKSHRNIADILIHEFFYSNQDKHWSSLENMYQEKANSLLENDKKKFKTLLNNFLRDVTIKVKGEKVLMPQLKTAYFILTVFKVWYDLKRNYDLPSDILFSKCISEFEVLRATNPKIIPYVNFTSALGNAGYAQNRINERHQILMSYILKKYPTAKFKNRDSKRIFSIEQKIAIWERADKKCQFPNCSDEFPNFKDADADHIIMWNKNGETTVENGRLLCKKHNRGRKE